MSIVPARETSEPGSSTYDVVFVGTGISNTFTLIEFLDGLEPDTAEFARILLIDKDPDFFKGVPYGRRSGDLGLIISRLSDFLPHLHLGPFATWLAEHREQAFARFFELGGEQVEQWRAKYWPDVEAGAIAELYLPRYIFGLYFEHLARRAIERAEQRGVASCETAVGQVLDLTRSDDVFTVVTLGRDGRELGFLAHRVVLGLGSAPSKRLLDTSDLGASGVALIDDPFEPGIADMVARVRAAVDAAGAGTGRVLVIGSNAGALDVIFNLMNDRSIASGINRIDVISTSGRFPELFYIHAPGFRPPFVAEALADLAGLDGVRADEVFDAAKRDIDRAREDGLSITDTFWEISGGFNSLLEDLSPQEKLRFASDTGPRIGTLQRRAGRDYRSVIDALASEGRLVVEAGRFPVDIGDDLVAVINCAGSERLSNTHSALVRTLLERGWLSATDSGFGIRVTDDLETDTAGLYVMGPMLTGNVLRGDPVWNLEHCGRIALFARNLAAHLVERAFAGSPS